MQSISTFNVETLKEIQNLNLHDFGIYLELEPDEEEKAQLEQNIQIALQSGGIDLEDAIDIRQIKNIKLANQSLKYKRKKKIEREQKQQQQNIQAQAEANAQLAEKSAMAEVQKQEALAQTQIQIEQIKSQLEIQRMHAETALKKELMAEEFNYSFQLAQMNLQQQKEKITEIEDRKDKRIKMQGTQQSELIDQRKNDSMPKDFESSGNDVMNGLGLGSIEI